MIARNVKTGLLVFALVLAGCSAGRTIETTPYDARKAPTGMSVPYSLPRGLLSFTVKTATGKPAEITYNGVELVPDETARYVATFSTHAFSNDKFKVTLDKGLLTLASNTTSDATPTFVSKLTSGVSGILQGSPVENIAGRETPSIRTFLVDPFNHPPRPVDGVKVGFKSLRGAHVDHQPTHRTCPSGSVCFPLLMTVKATVTFVADGTSAEFVTVVPDPWHVAAVDVNRFACVQTATSVGLENGLLTSYEVEKASEAVGCLSIPLQIVSAIIRAPIDAITGRTERLKVRKGLLDAQAGLIAQQTKLIADQAALLDAQTGE